MKFIFNLLIKSPLGIYIKNRLQNFIEEQIAKSTSKEPVAPQLNDEKIINQLQNINSNMQQIGLQALQLQNELKQLTAALMDTQARVFELENYKKNDSI